MGRFRLRAPLRLPLTGAVSVAGDVATSDDPALPAWLPAVGDIGNVSLNELWDVRDAANADSRLRGNQVLNSWSSTTYVPTLGAYGSILCCGGGHSEGIAADVYRYDIETRLFTRIVDPYSPVPVAGSQPSTVGDISQQPVRDPEYNEFWTDDTKTAVIEGQMMGLHTYAQLAWVPGALVENTNGYLVIGGMNRQLHRIDLDSPSAGWARFGDYMSGAGDKPGYGTTVLDVTRARLYVTRHINGPQSTAFTIALPSGTYGTAPNLAHVYYRCTFHAVADDLYLFARTDVASQADANNPALTVYDPASNTKVIPEITGDIPPNGPGTWEWIESRRQLVFWPQAVDGVAHDTLYFCTAPADPMTQAWAWTSQTFGGDAPLKMAGTIPNQLFKRLHWVEALSTFVVVVDRDLPVQAWRIV